MRISVTPSPTGPDVARVAFEQAIEPGQYLRPALLVLELLEPGVEGGGGLDVHVFYRRQIVALQGGQATA
jgi:hypothetical protein